MTIKFLIKNLVKAAGPAGIAEKMSINPKTLSNKIDPNQDTHHLYVEEIDSLVDALNTDEIAHYFAEQRGLMCIKKPDFNNVSDRAIYDLALIAREKEGDYAKVIRAALQDGEIDFQESAVIRQKFLELLAAKQEHQNKLDSFMAVCEEQNILRARKK